jgi:hypothetical protein
MASRSPAAAGAGSPRQLRLAESIATWMGYVAAASLDNTLWFARREAWEQADPADAESEVMPKPPQMLAALQVFCWMFGGGILRAWVHLAAEMQAGKSGVANAVIRLVLQNHATLGITPQRIFVLTGMSDDAWKKQTRSRVPRDVRHNVHHNGGLKKVQAQLHKLAAADGLRNVLIILDESQVAAAASNRVNTLVYGTLRSLVPPSEWVARNIRILTVSATDPAKVMAMKGCEVPCRAVRLQTTDEYQSVESLWNAKRVRALETFGDIGSEKSMAELKRVLASYSNPLWHILRPRQGKTAEVEAKLRAQFPHARVVAWDSAPKTTGDDSSSESTKSLEDINTLLAKAPDVHSFVLLKNMFYAAKTLNDTHVGVLWDRLGGAVGGDNARLQSLLGRACGYKKSKRTVVYTSQETVERYLTFWREMCYNVDADGETTEHTASALNRRMVGVVAVATESGGAKIAPAKSVSNPVTSVAANAVAAGAGRVKLDKDNFEVEWREFASFEEAKVWATRIHPKGMDGDGFMLSSTTGAVKRLSYADVMSIRGMKATAGFGSAKKLLVGKSCYTHYPCYRNVLDVTSAVHVVGKLTRLR